MYNPKNIKTNEEAMKMLEEIESVDEVKTFVDKKLENKEMVHFLRNRSTLFVAHVSY